MRDEIRIDYAKFIIPIRFRVPVESNPVFCGKLSLFRERSYWFQWRKIWYVDRNGHLRLTHAMTHEQKKRGGNSGTESTCGWGNPAANLLYSPEIHQKTSLSNLHTHEATGSSPVVSTKNHRNQAIPVIFFRDPQLFWMLNFRRFFKTHTLTHTGKGAESTGQGQTGFFRLG